MKIALAGYGKMGREVEFIARTRGHEITGIYDEYSGFKLLSPEALKKQLAAGKSDGEILQWIDAKSTKKPSVGEILAWSMAQEQRGPTDVDGREYFNELHKTIAPKREDISTWFDLLDLDDYVSYGGKP